VLVRTPPDPAAQPDDDRSALVRAPLRAGLGEVKNLLTPRRRVHQRDDGRFDDDIRREYFRRLRRERAFELGAADRRRVAGERREDEAARARVSRRGGDDLDFVRLHHVTARRSPHGRRAIVIGHPVGVHLRRSAVC